MLLYYLQVDKSSSGRVKFNDFIDVVHILGVAHGPKIKDLGTKKSVQKKSFTNSIRRQSNAIGARDFKAMQEIVTTINDVNTFVKDNEAKVEVSNPPLNHVSPNLPPSSSPLSLFGAMEERLTYEDFEDDDESVRHNWNENSRGSSSTFNDIPDSSKENDVRSEEKVMSFDRPKRGSIRGDATQINAARTRSNVISESIRNNFHDSYDSDDAVTNKKKGLAQNAVVDDGSRWCCSAVIEPADKGKDNGQGHGDDDGNDGDDDGNNSGDDDDDDDW